MKKDIILVGLIYVLLIISIGSLADFSPEPENPYEVVQPFVINKKTFKFHKEDCVSVHNMKETTKVYKTASYNLLIKYGYKRCFICYPEKKTCPGRTSPFAVFYISHIFFSLIL